MKEVDVFLNGVGFVGRELLTLLSDPKRCTRYGFRVRVVGAVDSRGGVWDANGIAPAALLKAKEETGTVANCLNGKHGASALDFLTHIQCPPILMESTLVNLETGGPGLAAMRHVLKKGGHAITANKGPLVVAFTELSDLAAQTGGTISYNGTLGLPLLMVRYHLEHVVIERLEGIVNGTTNYMLSQMTSGLSFADALRNAQASGIAEADPTLDVSGQDAANKLVILANTLLHQPTTLKDVPMEGIEKISTAELQAAVAEGEVVKLLISATRNANGCYDFSVGPRRIAQDHPLAMLSGPTVGLWIRTDINGDITTTLRQEKPTPTAAAMLYDLIQLYGSKNA